MRKLQFLCVLPLLLTANISLADPAPQWEQEAQTRVEKHRKGDFSIRVVDVAGRPVPNVPVRATMTRHAFPFGTVINAKRLAASQAGDPYLENIPKLFNRGTLENGYKWRFQEEEDKRSLADAATRWMLRHDMTIHAHVMMWATLKYGAVPKDVVAKLQSEDADKDEYVRRRTLEHIAAVGARYRGQAVEWDVLNEHFSEHEISKVLSPDTPKERAPILVEWFKAARAADPDARLFINDFGILVGDQEAHKASYEQTIEYLLQQGAPLGGIGMQSHFTHAAKRQSPADTMKTLDRFARFGLPIQITEFDTFGGGWGETPEEKEATQAEYFRTFLMTTFSHPSVSGFTMWGFWDGQHWQNDAPLFRKDWTPKPGYKVYSDLVFDKWWTKAEGVTDENGEFRFRGFFGDYEIALPQPNETRLVRSAKLNRNGESVVLPLALGEAPPQNQ